MAVADFKPTLGMIELSTSGSILTGNNAAFCAKFLDKGVGGAPVSLESLTYVLPGQNREGERNQPSVVVNLLMQLRASCDQNNFFLRTGQAAQAQVTARLHQVLGQCSGAARAQAGEIERAIRTRLVQEEEFSRALRKLERELKKNNVSLNHPLPEKETGRWSGSPFRQEKGRTARPEGPRNFLRIQMHRSELLWSISMRQEERVPRRTGSHPDGFLKTEKRIFSEAGRPGEEGRGEQLAYLREESGAFVPEPLQKQEKELSRPAGKRRKGGKSPEKRRESQTVQAPETERAARTVQVPETERITLAARPSENNRENRTGQVPESMPPEARLLPQPVRAERYIYPDNIYQIPGIPDENVRWTWRQVPQRAYAPVNWQMFRSVSPARIVPAREGGTVQFVPVFRREQLSGETGGTIFSVRELWTHSNNISILGRERPVREHTAKEHTAEGRTAEEHTVEEYTTEQYTVQNGPSPEARLLSRFVRAERYIYRDNVYRPPEVPDSSVHGSRRQILEGNGPEIYRKLLKRREIHWRTLGQAGGGLLRREFLPSVTKSSFQQAFPQYVQENFPSEPPQSGLQSLWFKLPQVSQKIWRQTTLRRYAPVNRQMFRSVFPARTLPSGKDGAVRFVPVFRGEQLPGKTGRTIFSVRELWTHFNNIAILGRERPVQEEIAEEYKTEQYTVQNGQLPETRLLSQPAAAGRYGYLIPPWPADVPGWRAGRLRQPKLEQNIPGLYRQGPVRGERAKLILRRVVDWAKELVRGPAERTVPGRNISSGTQPEPPFSGGAELRYARPAEKRREQEPTQAILTRHDERAGARRGPLWRMLRSVERGTPPELWKTEDFLRETWTKNHILYRALRQKNEVKAEGHKTLLYTERENEREAFRRNSVSEPQSPSLSPRLTHFTQPLEAAEGIMLERPVYRAAEDRPPAGAPERTEGNPAIVYRSPARPASPAQPQAASPVAPGQLEGEDVFRAQTVSDGQVRAMEQAFSYQAPGNRREESERSGFESAYAPRAEESINYNRLTEEILVRLERRLRAERRKFGL